MFNLTDYRNASATPASISAPAAGAGRRNVLTSFSASLARITNAGNFRLNLRDGATGAGTILLSWQLGVTNTGESVVFGLSGLRIIGSANTALTLEFETTAVDKIQSVAIAGIIV